jgi:hypothetical protein
MRNFLLASLAAAVIVPFFVADAQAGTPPSVICKDRHTTPQIEVDADLVALRLRDGFVTIREAIEGHMAAMKKEDNFSDTHTQPFQTHLQNFLVALFCADPADVSATQDPKDKTKIAFSIDYWRAETNDVYEKAKDHPVTPGLIAGASRSLNSIKLDDRDQVIAQFNARAQLDNQPMRIFLNPQGELELIATTPIPNNASK